MTLLIFAAFFAVLGIVCILIPFHIGMTGICLLLLAAVLAALWLLKRKNAPKVWGRILIALTALSMTVIFGAMAAIIVQGRDDVMPEKAPKFVVVLGAQIQGDQPSLTLKKRLDRAYEYLTEHPEASAFVSGGQGPGEAITEAECMRRALVRRGVDESRLYPEERSTSTQENLRYSRAILEELGVDLTQRVAIVTSDYHLCRARLMWGGDTAAVPAHLPSALYFQCLTVNYFIREAFGLAAYFVYGG